MSVHLPNTRLGVRRADPTAVDSHGAPVPTRPGAVTALLPGKRAEQDSGQWQLALDPSLWPVRVGDRVVADDGQEWVAVYTKLIQAPALDDIELDPGLDLDVAFIRVTGNQVTRRGAEPTGSEFVGRDEASFTVGRQPLGTSPLGGIAR